MNTVWVILAAIFADNFLLSRFFGIESFFSASEKKSTSLWYGALVTAVAVFAGTVAVLF